MEAATPLRSPHVRTVGGDRVAVDGLLVDDDTTIRLVREREEAGDDTVALLLDAVEIGARVLDREQTGANSDFVKSEFEKAARELQSDFGERARGLSEQLEAQLAEVFGPEDGVFAKELERLFSDGSTEAVQHRVKEVVSEALIRQLSADDPRNPLAAFQKTVLAVLKQSADQHDANQRATQETIAGLREQLQAERDDRTKQLELADERDRGTAKGRTFEEAVFDAVDGIAVGQGDTADAVGDVKEATGKVGDVVVAIDAAAGPPRGRIVFEAKNAKLSRPKALAELDEALAGRDAQFAILVVPVEAKIPARMAPLREYNGDKLIVCFDPEEGSRLALEVAYSLARARVLMAPGDETGVDGALLRDAVERALTAMEDVRKIKLALSGASTGIEKARDLLDEMAGRVRALLEEIDHIVATADESGSD
jgi:hypothetical protein